MPANKKYRIKYDVHCTLQNFFGKEIIIKNCWGEMHAKARCDEYARKKYGIEYSYIIVTSCVEENQTEDLLKDLFGDDVLKNKKTASMNDIFKEAFKIKKDKK